MGERDQSTHPKPTPLDKTDDTAAERAAFPSALSNAGPATLALPGAASMVARSMGVPIRLLPVLGRVVRPISEFFAPARPLVDRLVPLLVPGQTVLDLGCGKGGVSHQLAARARVSVVGVDAHAPFIDAARKIAASYAFAHRCRFYIDDVTAPGTWMRPADLVLALGLGTVYGTPEATVRFLATLVAPGGALAWGNLVQRCEVEALSDTVAAALDAAGFVLCHSQTGWAADEAAALRDRADRLASESRVLAQRSPMFAGDLEGFVHQWRDGVAVPDATPLIVVAQHR